VSYPRPKPRQVFVDPHDEEALAAADAGVVEQLKRTMESNPTRVVRSLVKEEIRNLSIGAISAYVRKRSEQIAELNDELPEFMR